MARLLLSHGGGLTLGYAGGAFFHEEDLHGAEDDFHIFVKAGFGYIHEIHEEFVIGCSVTVDLCAAGEAAFALEAEVPLGHLFFILGGDFRPFRSWPYDGHIALKDVQ